MCVPYWWCTKHAQLIMGTWPIYKKHFLQLILTKKKLSFDKISPRDFYFFLSFQSVLVSWLLHPLLHKSNNVDVTDYASNVTHVKNTARLLTLGQWFHPLPPSWHLRVGGGGIGEPPCDVISFKSARAQKILHSGSPKFFKGFNLLQAKCT